MTRRLPARGLPRILLQALQLLRSASFCRRCSSPFPPPAPPPSALTPRLFVHALLLLPAAFHILSRQRVQHNHVVIIRTVHLAYVPVYSRTCRAITWWQRVIREANGAPPHPRTSPQNSSSEESSSSLPSSSACHTLRRVHNPSTSSAIKTSASSLSDDTQYAAHAARWQMSPHFAAEPGKRPESFRLSTLPPLQAAPARSSTCVMVLFPGANSDDTDVIQDLVCCYIHGMGASP